MRLLKHILVVSVACSTLLACPQGGPTLTVPGQFATIQAAIVAAPSSAIIQVSAGVYPEVLDLLGKDVEIHGLAGPGHTVIDGAGFGDACVTVNSGELLAALVGFTIKNGAGKPFSSSYGFDYYGGGVYVGNASALRIEDCWIVDNALATGTFAGGVYVGGSGSHVDVRGCLIAGNHAWASGGAALVDHSATMRLERCTVFGNTANAWGFGHQGGISMANGGGVVVSDSIVWGNAGYQIRAFGGIYGAGTTALVSFCCVQGGQVGLGNVSTDPQFVDPGSRDFHLQMTSPCIDAGDPASPLDPDGTRADMGAFSFTQAGLILATATTYGTGCGSPALDMVPGQRPVIGTSATAMVNNAPTPIGGVAMGWSKTLLFPIALPFELSSIGMPGCYLLQSNQAFGLPVTGGVAGTLQFSYAIPSAPGLLGTHVYLQGYAYAPAANAMEVIASNGVDWLLGNQ